MCPLIDNGDKRCSRNLCLKHLELAFAICAGDYQECPIYREYVGRDFRTAEKRELQPVLS
jgi:hypothetical protein